MRVPKARTEMCESMARHVGFCSSWVTIPHSMPATVIKLEHLGQYSSDVGVKVVYTTSRWTKDSLAQQARQILKCFSPVGNVRGWWYNDWQGWLCWAGLCKPKKPDDPSMGATKGVEESWRQDSSKLLPGTRSPFCLHQVLCVLSIPQLLVQSQP